MASTLFLADDHAPSSSTHLRMPQVFVVPPEEDDTPAWCCFDANIPPATSTSYTNSPYHVLNMLQEDVDVPLFHYNLKEPRSLESVPSDSDTTSIMDVLMNDDCMEFNNETGLDADEIGQDPDLEANLGNDSEVVEVVKVDRYTTEVEEYFHTSTPPARPSKSLKTRALGVFSILKIAEKGPSRSRSKAQVISSPISEGTRVKKRTRSCHSSTTSLQLYHSPTTPKASPSVSSFDLAEVSSMSSLNRSRYPLSLRNVSLSSARPSLLASSSNVSPSRNPLPTSSTRPLLNRRHFSLAVNRIFSFSKSDKVSDVSPASRSDKSPGLSTESTSEPETPTEEATSLTPEHTSLPAQKCLPPGDTTLDERDLSFEMRLDSLHFDSLSFDVDKF